MQPPSSAAALQSLTDYNSTRKSAKDITTEAQGQYDIPGYNTRLSSLRGLVGNLQSSVNAVDPSVTGRTSGSFVTEGQRAALVNKEQAPILGSLAKEQGALGQEEQGYQNASGLATQLATAMISGDQTKYQSLLDQYNASVASEQAAEQKRQYESNMAEQKRQFDLQQAAAAKASGSGGAGGYNLASLASALGANKGAKGNTGAQGTPQQAYNTLKDLLATKNKTTILNTIAAIQKSAGYGNAYDKQKLSYIQNELARQFQPYIVSNNSQLSF